jgi:hypothetical protein
MLHLIIGAVITVGTLYFPITVVVLAARIVWLAVLLAAWIIMAGVTGVLAIALGVQKVSQAVADWRWRRRYGEILPPE